MATQPKYPPEIRPRPQLVRVHANRPPRSFTLMMALVSVLIVAVVILLAVWLLKYGGGSPQEQPKPHPNNGTPAGMMLPRIQPRRPPLYAWAK